MKLIKSALLAAAVLFAATIQAQTVDEIINKHIDAIGGKEKLGQLKSVYIETSVDVMGNAAPQKEYLLEGKGYKSEVEFNGAVIINCFNDKNGWSVNPMAGGTDPQAMPDGLYKSGRAQIYIDGPLADYAAKGYKAELSGTEGESFKIKVTGDGNESYYFIDQKTYLLTKSIMKSEMMGQSVDVTTTYSEHKKTDFGITLPYAKNVDMGMFQMAQKVNKIEVNKEMDLKIFEISK